MSDSLSDDRLRRDEHIVSPSNPTVKLARSLSRRRVRQRERAILVEGMRAISSAMSQGAALRAVMIDRDRRAQVAEDDVQVLRAAVDRLLFIEPELFDSIADAEHPQPVIAICGMPRVEIPPDSTFVLAIDGVRDPGNLGTLIRTAAAAGIDGVAVLPGAVDLYNPKVIRASAGALFAIPVASFPSIERVGAQCFAERPTIVLADGEGDVTHDAVAWTTPTLLVIGGEASGAGEEARTYADVVARISIESEVESLNAAVAGAIFLFEARRQRDAAGRNRRTDADFVWGKRVHVL
ncbi:MAG TPA: RNA methyltransferase [Thermomicrobiales bacterium]|nr:RNA methyltransferase [Thermomicrobiales bacterium]